MLFMMKVYLPLVQVYYSHKDAEGFIKLFGLPCKIKAMMEIRRQVKFNI